MSKFDIKISPSILLQSMPPIIDCKPVDNVKKKYVFSENIKKDIIKNVWKSNEHINDTVKNLAKLSIVEKYTGEFMGFMYDNCVECSFDGDFVDRVKAASMEMDKLNPDMKNMQKYVITSCYISSELEKMDRMLPNHNVSGTIYPIGTVGNVIIYINALMPRYDENLYISYGAELQYVNAEITLNRHIRHMDETMTVSYKKGQIPDNVITVDVINYDGLMNAELTGMNYKCIKF